MAKIQLTQGLVAIVDDSDVPLVSRYSWHVAKRKHTTYAAAWVEGRKKVLMHRLILGAAQGTEVDHRDGDGLNNSRANLRVGTKSTNMHNMKKHRDGTSRFKGVFACNDRHKTPWTAQIHPPGGRNTHLGRFAREEDAARAYDRAARQHFGDFALTNFPLESA